jgi:hypothetical protein
MELRTKYDINEEVYYISNNKVKNSRIISIQVKKYKHVFEGRANIDIYYKTELEDECAEVQLFKTKEELIASL